MCAQARPGVRKGLDSGPRPSWAMISGKQGEDDECRVARDKGSPPPIKFAVEEKEL